MFKKYYSITTFLLIIFAALSSFGSYSIMPTKIEINKNNKIATMTLQNNDYMPKKFQLVLLKREYIDGKEEYAPTTDLVATPIMFTLQGNKMRLIRIALQKDIKNFSTKEGGYRIEVRELPHRIKIDNGITSMINFVVQFNIPITISS